MSSEEKQGKAKKIKLQTIILAVLQKTHFANENGDVEKLIEEVSQKYDEVYKVLCKEHRQHGQEFIKSDTNEIVLHKKCAKCTKKKCTNCINKK